MKNLNVSIKNELLSCIVINYNWYEVVEVLRLVMERVGSLPGGIRYTKPHYYFLFSRTNNLTL